jgi:hypothetical protein
MSARFERLTSAHELVKNWSSHRKTAQNAWFILLRTSSSREDGDSASCSIFASLMPLLAENINPPGQASTMLIVGGTAHATEPPTELQIQKHQRDV